MQGEFEERLKAIKDEVAAAAGDITLFIDELHTVVGAGRSGGGLDASNMLKPALAKGLLLSWSNDSKEYKQYIETDRALERRFQMVKVEEPQPEEAIAMLQSLKITIKLIIKLSTRKMQSNKLFIFHKYIQERTYLIKLLIYLTRQELQNE